MLQVIRRRLITGFLAVLPLVLTIWAVSLIVRLLDGVSQPVIKAVFGSNLPGLGLILTLVLLYMVGGLIPHRLVTKLAGLGEYIIHKVPLAGTIYAAVKQTVQALKINVLESKYSRVVFVEYPNRGLWALGFVTRDINFEGSESTCVFVPTTPNPTSGMLVVVKNADLIPSTMSVEDAVKFVISGGVVSPEEYEIDKRHS